MPAGFPGKRESGQCLGRKIGRGAEPLSQEGVWLIGEGRGPSGQ